MDHPSGLDGQKRMKISNEELIVISNREQGKGAGSRQSVLAEDIDHGKQQNSSR